LNNEKVDVIPWSSDIKAFVTKALEPAKIKSIEVNEAARRPACILVAEDQLSLAIGKRGQNARLTARLTGWEVDIDAEQIVTKGFEEKVAEAVAQIAAIPGITREQADALVHAGITRLEDLLSAEAGDLRTSRIGESAAAIWKPRTPRRGAGSSVGRSAAGQQLRFMVSDRNCLVVCDLSHDGEAHIPVGGSKKIYARSYLRHCEETWPREQRNHLEGQGIGHCRRQGSVQLAR
jgi:hypothetical protein